MLTRRAGCTPRGIRSPRSAGSSVSSPGPSAEYSDGWACRSAFDALRFLEEKCDFLAPVYDGAIRRLYLPYRKIAVESLRLKPGNTVLDLGCGSGLNFELLVQGIGAQGTLIGVDYSARMLARAQRKIDDHGWKNAFLIKKDARDLEPQDLDTLAGRSVRIERVLCTLGLRSFLIGRGCLRDHLISCPSMVGIPLWISIAKGRHLTPTW